MWLDAGRPASGTLHHIKISCQLKYKLAIRQAFVDFENRHTDDLHLHFLNKNMPEFWKVWNKKFNKSAKAPVCINGSSNDQHIADEFAAHFSDMFTVPSANVQYLSSTIGGSHQLTLSEATTTVDYEMLDKCIQNLKCGKAGGPDGLTAEHILHAHPLVISHLCALFRSMIVHSYVPDNFGQGTIIPLIKDKSGDFDKVDNYRGITLIPVVSKLLESVLLKCCEDKLVVDDLQYGFRSKFGCADAIFTMRQVVDHFTSRGSMVYAAALDISKDFDSVSHQKLMATMEQAGIPCWIIQLKSNWYSNDTAGSSGGGRSVCL